MRFVKLESDSSRFGDVAECVFGTKLVCKSPTNSSNKSFWFKRLVLGSSSKQKPLAFVVFGYVTFDAKRD